MMYRGRSSTPSLWIAVALLLACSSASPARAQLRGESDEDPHAPLARVVSPLPPEVEPRHETVWFWIGVPTFAGGVALVITALAIDDPDAAPFLGSVAAIPLTIGTVLLIVAVVRWMEIDAALGRYRERQADAVAFDPATLTLRW